MYVILTRLNISSRKVFRVSIGHGRDGDVSFWAHAASLAQERFGGSNGGACWPRGAMHATVSIQNAVGMGTVYLYTHRRPCARSRPDWCVLLTARYRRSRHRSDVTIYSSADFSKVI